MKKKETTEKQITFNLSGTSVLTIRRVGYDRTFTKGDQPFTVSESEYRKFIEPTGCSVIAKPESPRSRPAPSPGGATTSNRSDKK